MNKDSLLKQLMELDFMATDLALYLNTHPNDHRALSKYNETILQADKIRGAYEKHCGTLCSYRSLNPESWKWSNESWPWEANNNIQFSHKER